MKRIFFKKNCSLNLFILQTTSLCTTSLCLVHSAIWRLTSALSLRLRMERDNFSRSCIFVYENELISVKFSRTIPVKFLCFKQALIWKKTAIKDVNICKASCWWKYEIGFFSHHNLYSYQHEMIKGVALTRHHIHGLMRVLFMAYWLQIITSLIWFQTDRSTLNNWTPSPWPLLINYTNHKHACQAYRIRTDVVVFRVVGCSYKTMHAC